MVVDRFDPNSQRRHRSDEPVRPPIVGLPLVVIGAYRLLDIDTIESTLGQPQQSVIGPDERLDRHGLNDRSSTTLFPQALPDRMPGTRCRGPLAEIAAPRKGSPATIAANRPQTRVTGAGRHRGAFEGNLRDYAGRDRGLSHAHSDVPAGCTAPFSPFAPGTTCAASTATARSRSGAVLPFSCASITSASPHSDRPEGSLQNFVP